MRYRSDVLVLGAGAAGLMCAIAAGRRGCSVTVLERSQRAGQKILISGGGRCNFTNLECRAENYLSANPHFAKSALARYAPQDFLAMVERHGIRWHEKKLGQLFCDRSAQEILGMLEAECVKAGVRVKTGVEVREVRREGAACAEESTRECEAAMGSSTPRLRRSGRNDTFCLVTAGGDEYLSEKLVVATGGLSIPKMGATAFGYELARQFGLSVVEPRPALVALLLASDVARRWCDLAGVSAEVVASCAGRSFREKLLITHHGFSGPAILQISSYWQPGEQVKIDWAPGVRVFGEMMDGVEFPHLPKEGRYGAPSRTMGTKGCSTADAGASFAHNDIPKIHDDIPKMKMRRDEKSALAALRAVLPARVAERWLELYPMRRWTNAALEEAERGLHEFEFVPAGTEGFGKAEVTAGGVDTNELSSKTMEAKRVPGLYFVGEVVDVTGWLGGYNFQWAWASGWCAGEAV